MVDVMGDPVAFAAVKEAIFPVPLAARPIAVLELVHAKVVPVTALVKVAAGTAAPAQRVEFAGTVTAGVGFTVMVYVEGVPGQPLAVGVTVIVAVIGAVPALVAVKAGVLPVPLAARPIAALELVHAKVVPATPLVKLLAATAPPLQTVMLAGTVTAGLGFTVMV